MRVKYFNAQLEHRLDDLINNWLESCLYVNVIDIKLGSYEEGTEALVMFNIPMDTLSPCERTDINKKYEEALQ